MAYIKSYQERKDEVENYISTLIAEIQDFPQPLLSAVTYGLTSGGKRIRPVLFLETYRFLGGEVGESAVKMALAVECIHTYSLIHDDLPCMDDDDFRRGKPTVHKVYGEANAVLAGDALLNLAYQMALKAVLLHEDPDVAVRAASVLANASGGAGLVGGQTLDLLAEDDVVMPEKIEYIYSHKTGDLITAAILSGAILANATATKIEALRKFGSYFGLAFQIRDDILDAENKNEIGKNTYVRVYGLAASRATLADCIDKALLALAEIDGDTSFLRKLALKSADRKE